MAGRWSAPRSTSSSRCPAPGGSDTTALANVVVRGISPAAWTVRNNVRIEAGRKPESGKAEICVGQEDGGPVQPHRHRRDPALRRPELERGLPLQRRRLGVRVGDLGRERAVHAGVPGRRLPVGQLPAQGSGRVRRGQADARGRPAAHGGRAPRIGFLRQAVAAAGPDPHRFSRS